jgi:hypothetical protein
MQKDKSERLMDCLYKVYKVESLDGDVDSSRGAQRDPSARNEAAGNPLHSFPVVPGWAFFSS